MAKLSDPVARKGSDIWKERAAIMFEREHVKVPLKEKHPREAEIARTVLEPYRHYPSAAIIADEKMVRRH